MVPCLLFAAGAARACIIDVGLNATGPMNYLFPNWEKAEVVDFDTIWCDATGCPGAIDATIRGLTIFNYGTAVGGTDIKGVSVCFGCSRASAGACTPNVTLAYAGVWNVGGFFYPAWTWAGSLALNADPCNGGPGGCGCIFVMRVFVDIAPCPTNLATVQLGPGFNDILPGPAGPGGITDGTGCAAPVSAISDPAAKTIVYAVKEGDRPAAAPGDTVTYTVFYGRPGTAPLSAITVFDSLPPFTHYLGGSASPAPDTFWDPDPGPPLRLKWTLPGGAVTGGPTGQLTFKLTVDWGNGESFEPGSGNTAAPEQLRLGNRALVEFNGIAGCGSPAVVTEPTDTVVRRFLFWKIGDNDVLFSPTYGQPPDEMVYSIYVKNMSGQKTWWDVRIWDTVPPELDPWCANCGFDDPCQGWTMTPSGCAAATPGRLVSGPATLLTWKLDMPPGATLTVRWKAQVRPTITAGATAIGRASILEVGLTGIFGGTGNSSAVRSFAHLAPILLPTTYISYVAYAAGGDDNTCPGFFIDFFPLNKATQFELRGIQYQGAGWAANGGVSSSIGCLIGDCVSGFPGSAVCGLGSGAIPGGGISGCKIERIPSRYDGWTGSCATYPENFVYKLTSNAPVLWQLLTHVDDDNQDNHTYAPSTTLSFTGLMHYAWRRSDPVHAATPGYGDSFSMISTNMDPYGVYNPALRTTVHLFIWSYVTLAWEYRKTYELDVESQALDMGTLAVDDAPWRTVSSDTRLIVNEGFNTFTGLACCCAQCGDNYGAFMPTRETGNVVSATGAGTFYGIVQGPACCGNLKMVIGNTGLAAATYNLWKYLPASTLAAPPIPAQLNGSSGNWVQIGNDTVPFGQATAGNPYQYWGAFNNPGTTGLFKVELVSGGPIQVLHGVNMFHVWGGGAMMHAANGQQTGTDYWLNQVQVDTYTCKGYPNPTQVINVFCPRSSMAIRCTNQSGYSATYTTTGPDQCVGFMDLTQSGRQNYRIQVLAGPSFGNVIAMYIQCKNTEKGYTAPFLQAGTHYTIIAPPTVFIGQSLWITIVVFDNAGTTKTDYCGTTSFTSTDPGAKIEGLGMDAYNFQWSSTPGLCNNNGVAADEDGVRVFVNVSFTRLGLQTIIGQDMTDGSITGLTVVMVVGADVKLSKEPRLSVQASGDTVRFKVCWSNYSSASAFTFVITDAVPMGTTFVPEAGTASFDCGSTDGVAITTAYSASTLATPPPAGSFVTGNPTLSTTRWLRWTLPMAGVGTTGCVCFRVSVN